jgi:hypothetical protein
LGRTNNPVEIGTFESARIWPHSLLDIVVSLGTGSSCPGSPRLLGPRGILHDGFLPRLYRSFMTSLNGQKIWDDLWNRLPVEAKDRYFRLNVRFDGKEPDIDNIGEMESLIDPGTRLPTDSETCLKIVQSLISKQFYFELDGWPLYRSGQFLCSGHIYCRFNGDLQLALLIYLRRMHARFLIGDKPITELLSHVPPNAIPGGKFGSGVEFVIRSFNECISLSLHLSGNAREISGFPTTIDSLMRAQNLNCIFGSDNHKRLAIHSESTRKRQRTSR